jgi:hypothetical protein
MTYLVKAASEATLPLCTIVPLFVNDTESNVLVRGSSDEADEASVLSPSRRKRFAPLATVFTLDTESRCFGCVNKIRVEDVELVALNDLGREVFVIVMSLVVLVPLVTHLDSVEVAWFSWAVRLCPFRSASRDILLGIESFFVIVEASSGLSVVECTCDPGHVVPPRFGRQGQISTGRLGAMTSWDVAELENPAPILNLSLGQHDASYVHGVPAYQSLLELLLFHRIQRLVFRI